MDQPGLGDLTLRIKEAALMTWDGCRSLCAAASFAYFGLRFNLQSQLQECWCGFTYGSWGALPLDACDFFCAVSPLYRCGSKLERYRSDHVLSVYAITDDSSGAGP